MKFQISPQARKLIMDKGCQITVSIEKEQCYACGGDVSIPYLFARIGKPNDLSIKEYKMISEDSICIYVSNDFEKLDTSVVLAIELNNTNKYTLDIYGLVHDF